MLLTWAIVQTIILDSGVVMTTSRNHELQFPVLKALLIKLILVIPQLGYVRHKWKGRLLHKPGLSPGVRQVCLTAVWHVLTTFWVVV